MGCCILIVARLVSVFKSVYGVCFSESVSVKLARFNLQEFLRVCVTGVSATNEMTNGNESQLRLLTSSLQTVDCQAGIYRCHR